MPADFEIHITIDVNFPQLIQGVTQIMANLNQIQADLADLSTTVTSLSNGLDTIGTEIADLKAQIAAGGVITQADLDGLDATVQTIRAYDLDRRFTLLLSPVFSLPPNSNAPIVSPAELAQWLLESGLDARLQLQLHKFIWDPQARGV